MKHLLCLQLIIIAISGATAQTPIQIEYLDVPDSEILDHEETQKNEMATYHQKLFDKNEIYAWYHYKSRYPLGDDENYNYVVVTVFSNSEVMDRRNNDMSYLKWLTRKEIYNPNRKVRSPDYGVIKTDYISVDFLKRELKDSEEYTNQIVSAVKPLLDQRVKDQVVVNYSIFDLVSSSTSVTYDHVLVTRLKEFEAAEIPAPIEITQLNKRKKTVLWELLEIVY